MTSGVEFKGMSYLLYSESFDSYASFLDEEISFTYRPKWWEGVLLCMGVDLITKKQQRLYRQRESFRKFVNAIQLLDKRELLPPITNYD